MPICLNTIKSVASKVNSKGASLLRKDVGLSVKNAAKEGLKVPQEAATYDAVRVGRNFKPNESYTDIFTFRDKSGNIVQRCIKEVDNDDVKITKKRYEEVLPCKKKLGNVWKQYIEIPAKKVRAYTRENGKISQITEDVFAVAQDEKPIVTHSKKTIEPVYDGIYKSVNRETFMLEQRQNGVAPKFIKNEYEVDGYAPGYAALKKSEVSSPELKEIAENNYLLPHVSKDNKFPYRIAQANISDYGFIAPPKVKLYKEKSACSGYYSMQDIAVNINLKTALNLKRPRISLTSTIGHEVGHAKWDDKCLQYEMYKSGVCDAEEFLANNKMSDIPIIERYKYAIKHYVPSSVNSALYRKNYAEVIADEEGRKSVKKLTELSKSLEKSFPYQHDFQFNRPNENEDSIMELLTLLECKT